MAGRHARDYYTAAAPPASPQPEQACPPTVLDGQPASDWRMVPTFTKQSIGQGGTQLYSGSIATATPQTFTPASSPPELNGFGVDNPNSQTLGESRAAHRPISTRLEPASLLRSVNHWFTLVTPSDLARQARTVWQFRHVPPLSGPLATHHRMFLQVRLPPRFNQAAATA